MYINIEGGGDYQGCAKKRGLTKGVVSLGGSFIPLKLTI